MWYKCCRKPAGKPAMSKMTTGQVTATGSSTRNQRETETQADAFVSCHLSTLAPAAALAYAAEILACHAQR